MSEFAPPTGPPPPKVPAGWKAVWNAQYSEWFYVNTYTKQSQWDKPNEPVYGPPAGADAPPGGPPPGYDPAHAAPPGPEKGALGSNNPYAHESGPGGPSHQMSEDEKMARQLQAEEDARAHGGASNADRGAADSYYAGGQASPYPPQQGGPGGPGSGQHYDQMQLPPRPDDASKPRGLLGKLMGKGKQRPPQPQQQYGGYGGQQPYPQQGGYGGYPPQGYPPQHGYPPQQGYGQPMYAQQQPPKKHGLGAGGAAALGVGGGLLGGLALGEALGHDGGDDGGDDGGGWGGDDGGGFGGDDGGGDFGGD